MWHHHDEEFNQVQRRKVKIYKNGDFEHGKDLFIEPEWNLRDFLNACSLRLNTSSCNRVFNTDGHEIDDCMMFEDNDILFLSNGDDFIPLGSDNEGVLYLKNGNTWETIPSIISGYKIGKLLGRGGFGEVRMGEHQLTKEKVALKFLTKAEIVSMGAAERTTTEIQCLSALRHAHIIRLQQHLESPKHVILVFELMEGGDLFHYLLDKQIEAVKASTESISAFQYALPEDEARHVFNQIISAIGYAHNQHICHRDLKLENILLKAKNLSCVKVADFGLSAFYRPGAHMKSSCGTLSFLAPEVFAGTSNAGPPLDVWALGVILFALLCGRLPFEGPDLAGTKRPRDAVIRSRISKGQYKIEEGLSPEAKDLVRRMLRVDPTIRATVPEIFSHVWMRAPSQNYDPYLSGLREREVMSPLSLIQKLSVNSNTPAAVTPTPRGSDSQISTPRSSIKLPNLVQTTPREEDAPPIDMEEAITIQSSSENELDNLPTFDIDRVVSKLQSISTDDSADDAIETLISGRRSSTKSEPDEMSSSPTPKSSFVLIPLRRNPQGPKDIPASPRRPKTAIDDEEFLAKFRQDTWDIVTDEPSNNTTTARGKSHESNDSSHVRIRQSTGNLSARLHPIQRRQENGDKDHPISASSSPHTSRSSSHRKTLHPPSSSWTEQLEESKEALDTCCVESGKLFTKGSESAKAPLLSANDIPAQSHPRSKHSQLHLAGTSSLKSHTTSLTVNSQPSTPTQTRRKMPTTSSTNGLQPQRPTFVSSNSDRSLSPSLGISGHGAAGGSEIPSFLSSGNPRQISSRAGTSSSSRMSKIIDSNSPTISPNKVAHR